MNMKKSEKVITSVLLYWTVPQLILQVIAIKVSCELQDANCK